MWIATILDSIGLQGPALGIYCGFKVANIPASIAEYLTGEKLQQDGEFLKVVY